MPMTRTGNLKPGDIIRVPLKADALEFQVIGLIPIHGTGQRVTDVQVKLKVWPDGAHAPPVLWPVNRAWQVVKNVEVAKCT